MRTIKLALLAAVISSSRHNVEVTIQANSVDPDHAERDKHLRSANIF